MGLCRFLWLLCGYVVLCASPAFAGHWGRLIGAGLKQFALVAEHRATNVLSGAYLLGVKPARRLAAKRLSIPCDAAPDKAEPVVQTALGYGLHARQAFNAGMCTPSVLGRSALHPLPFLETPAAARRQTSIHGRTEVKIYNPTVMDTLRYYGFAGGGVLTHFLNLMLDFHGYDEITHVTRLSRERLALTDPNINHYEFFMKYHCHAADGSGFFVEVHNDLRGDCHAKALEEHRFALLVANALAHDPGAAQDEETSLQERKFWKQLKGVYTLVLSNEVLEDRKKHLKSTESMQPYLIKSCPANLCEMRQVYQLDRPDGGCFPNKIVFLMLDNLTNDVAHLKTSAEKWGFVFKDENLRLGNKKAIQEQKLLKNVNLLVEGEPELERFIEHLEVGHMPYYDKEREESRLGWYHSNLMGHYEECLAEGKKKGLEEAHLRMAANLETQRFSDEQIKAVLRNCK